MRTGIRVGAVSVCLVACGLDAREHDRVDAGLDEASEIVDDEAAPTIVVAEGSHVIPQTVVHLDVHDDDADDPVTAWSWSVVQPEGSKSVFANANIQRPRFEANVAGDYTFTVQLTTRARGVLTATYLLRVVPEAGLHIELLWRTPGDANEVDEGAVPGDMRSAGSDLDVHVVSPVETPWFDAQRDCYWLHKTPTWDALGVGQLPTLDRDDTDGAGPENINVDAPPLDACYRVGVHYWDAWSYGPAEAVLRVYVDGVRTTELRRMMVEHDLWTVADICAGGQVTTIDALQAEFPRPDDLW